MAVNQGTLPKTEKASLASAAAEHITVIEPARGWSALRLHELWEYRDLLYYMTMRDLQARYRQMALGPLWIIIQPLLSMVLYTIIFGNIARLPSEGQPYAVFTFVGLLPWGVFTEAVAGTANSLLSNKALLNKVYFPRLLLPISRFISSLVDFAIAFLLLLIILAAYGRQPNWGVVVLPFYLLVAGLCGIAVGLWFAGIIVHYRDFGQISGMLVRFWMYATPVVYSISLIPEKWLPLYHLNPMTGVVQGFRWALLGTAQPPLPPLLGGLVVVVIVFIGGLYHFKRVERNIVDIA